MGRFNVHHYLPETIKVLKSSCHQGIKVSPSNASTDMTRKIEVVDYDPKWPELFKSEAERVKQALGGNCVEIQQYCNGKDAFVASIDAKDGFDRWRMVKALTDREWDAVRLLRWKYFFKSKEDPYTCTFTHKDHVHFVFYKNAEIIGYAHLQL